MVLSQLFRVNCDPPHITTVSRGSTGTSRVVLQLGKCPVSVFLTCISLLACHLYMCPHTTIYVSSYYKICVIILLYMCPHTLVQLCLFIGTQTFSAHPPLATCLGDNTSLHWRRRNFDLDDGQLDFLIIDTVYLNLLKPFWFVHEGEGGQEPLRFARKHGNPLKVHAPL
jgi:hypothetical protein